MTTASPRDYTPIPTQELSEVANQVYQRRRAALERLLVSIQEQGGLDVPDDEEAFFTHMQTIRQEIHDEEYGHLYS
jgi:hypothetical protein